MSPMGTRSHEAAFEAFRATGLGDESSYPNHAVFIGADEEWADDALWESLHEGRPTVIVRADGSEVMVVPARVSRPQGLWNELLRRISVDVYVRREHEAPSIAMHAAIGRHALGKIGEPALA